jgi:hypothetical protein
MLSSMQEVHIMPNDIKYSPFAIRLPSDLRKELEDKANAESRSLSNLIVRILEEWVQNN